jgi:hypothetical protein
MRRPSTTFAIALVLAGFAALACGGGKVEAPPPAPPADPYAPCAAFEQRAREVWSPQIRGQLDLSVHIFQGEILAADAELAVNRLDEFTAAWIDAATGACRSHLDAGTLESDAYRALAACLDGALASQRAVVDAVKVGGKAAIAQAQTLPETIKGCSGQAIGASAATDMRDNPFQTDR